MPLIQALIGLENWGIFVLRIAIGIIFLYHSIPKLTKSSMLAKAIGKPTAFIVILGLAELIASFLVILGLYTQIGAIILSIVMLGAIYHKVFVWKIPFAAQDKTGFEFDLILLATALALLVLGAGTFSLDAIMGLYP